MSVRSGRAWLAAPALAMLTIGLVLPMVLIFVDSFRLRGVYGGYAPIEDLRAYLSSFDFLNNYENAVKPVYLAIFWRSLKLAVVSTLACLFVGYPMAWWMAMSIRPSLRSLALVLIIIPFWSSFVVRTFAWVWILRTEGLINAALMGLGIIHEPLPLLYNEGAVLVGLVYTELPFMVLPIYASLEKLDRTLLEAAADLGATPLEAFRRVALPLSMPGVAAGALLVFVPAVGQYIISDMLGGAKSMLVGNLIRNQFFGGKNAPFGFALSFLLMVLVLALLRVWPSDEEEAR